MHIDLAVISLIVLSGFFGYHSGATRQLAHWIGLGAAILLAKPTALLATPLVASAMQWPVKDTAAVLHYATLPFLFFAVGLVARFVLGLLEPGEERGPFDSALGAAVGLIRGAVISYAALSAMAYVEKPLVDLRVDLKGSRTYALARNHNLLAQEKAELKSVEKALDSRVHRGVSLDEVAPLRSPLPAALQR